MLFSHGPHSKQIDLSNMLKGEGGGTWIYIDLGIVVQVAREKGKTLTLPTLKQVFETKPKM